MDIVLFVSLFLPLLVIIEGGQECSEWTVTNLDTEEKFKLTEPFMGKRCGGFPIFVEEDPKEDPRVLIYDFIASLWTMGKGEPKCTKEKISGMMPVAVSDISTKEISALKGVHTWERGSGEMDLNFWCSRYSLSSGSFDHFRNEGEDKTKEGKEEESPKEEKTEL